MLQILYIIIVHLTLGWDQDITGITTNEKLADQYASDCILLHHSLEQKVM